MTLSYLILLGITYILHVIGAQEYDVSNQLCGSDGKTYDTISDLYEAKIGNPDLDVLHNGYCLKTSLSGYPSFLPEHDEEFETMAAPSFKKKSKESYHGHTHSQCTLNYSPVCGTDGNTYYNECNFNANKVYKPSLLIKHEGKCKKHKKGLTNENDDLRCTMKLKPVCGNDGNTYSNECFLNAKKINNPSLRIKHEGECKKHKKEFQYEKDELRCKMILKPVCGNDGNTYSNECFLNYDKVWNHKLRVKHQGHCRENLEEFKNGSEEISDETKNLNSINFKCTSIGSPVCGSDGKTYRTKCFLDFNTVFNRGLHLQHYGPCKERSTKTRDMKNYPKKLRIRKPTRSEANVDIKNDRNHGKSINIGLSVLS